MLDYCSIILTVHAALWVGGGGYTGTCPPRRRVDGVKHERAREREKEGKMLRNVSTEKAMDAAAP